MTTSARVLELLGLLQTRRHWPGEELARRLGVSQRTLRRDVDGLQALGYPIVTSRGVGGGYQLGAGVSLPPLVLSEDEAAATVLGLKEIATGIYPASAEAAVSAMAKIVQVLPRRIRDRVGSLRSVTTSPGGDPLMAPITDITALTTVALASRDAETVAFTYQGRDGAVTERTVQPHRIVSVDNRLYLLAWDLGRTAWRTFRIDRITDPRRTGQRFAHRRLPTDDPAEYVRAQLGSMPARYRVHATVEAPAEQIGPEIAHYGVVEALDETSCEVYIAAESLDWAAFCLGAIEAPFVIHGPPEAIAHIRSWGKRFADATEPAPARESPRVC